ncbi:hypothetical protein EAN91_02755 [Klebsiella pneumoniae]|nr:hypothetical protein EAN91_02755 [Klebsiella pneumoniae]
MAIFAMFMLTISNKDRPCKYRLSEQTRQYCYEEEHGKQSVTLRQIVALIDFADVKAGSEGGWVDEECAQPAGECWIYDVNSVVFGARIRDDARLTGFCVVSHEATIGGLHSHLADQPSRADQ